MSMQEEELRRRRGPGGGGGYEGIGGAAALPGMLLPHLQGIPTYRGGGSGGLAAFLQQMMGGAPGPASRNFQGAGGFIPPGLDQQEPIGGANPAPGNLDTGQALQQPGLGLAVGQTGVMPPQSQSWRNYAPGFGAAAQLGFGSENFNRMGAGAGPAPAPVDSGRGIPSTGVGEAPGVRQGPTGHTMPSPGASGQGPGPAESSLGRPGGGGPGAIGGGGPGDAGGRPGGPSQNQIEAARGGGNTSGGPVGGGDAGGNAGGPNVKQLFNKKSGGNTSTGHGGPGGGGGPSPDAGGSHGGPTVAQVQAKKGGAVGKKKGGPKVGHVTSGGWQTGGGF